MATVKMIEYGEASAEVRAVYDTNRLADGYPIEVDARFRVTP